MKINRLKIENFRNYEKQELVWDEQLNLLYGLNAQGKSNLLEAICYLGVASSFRAAGELDLIRYEQDYFYLEADAESEQNGKMRVSAAANRARQRKWSVNRESKTRLTDVVGLLHTVIFAPEDIYLIKAGPDARRRYLNRQMSQLDREYCRMLIEYNQVLRQRNACLKQWAEKRDLDTLDIWTAQLVNLGGLITIRRAQIARRLSPLAGALHAELSGGEALALLYRSSVCGEEEPAGLAEVSATFAAALKRSLRSELLHGSTQTGPHRDELLISLNRRPAKEFASQGQQRTAALALKLAELELGRQVRGEYPLLLLDDVLSELDAGRRKQILDLTLGKAQTFISAVDEIDLPRGAKWRISDGHAEQV